MQSLNTGVAKVLATIGDVARFGQLAGNAGNIVSAQADVAAAPLAESSDQIGLPEFADGPSVYAYAKSSPVVWVDPTGERVTWKTIRNFIDACLIGWQILTGQKLPRRPPPPPPSDYPAARQTN